MRMEDKKRTKSLIIWSGLAVAMVGLFWQSLSTPPQAAKATLYYPLNNHRPKDHAIIKKDGVYHVFSIYCSNVVGCDNERNGLMHLTSTDLRNWTEVGYVLPPPGGSTYDSYDIWAPSIVEKDGTYYMFYAAVKKNGLNVVEQRIALATSTDLISWSKYGSSPVIDCDNFSWAYYDINDNSGDGAACRDPYVMWDETQHQWIMYFSGRTPDDGSSPPWIVHPMVTGIATSTDLINWNEFGYISTTKDYTVESPHVFTHAGQYYLIMTDNADGGVAFSYLTSNNPYTGWSAQNHLLATNIGANEYASEYLNDNGKEIFTRVSNNNISFDFDVLDWSAGTPFTILDPAYGTIGDAVWADTDGDGVYDGDESGIDSVTVKLYLDDGDNIFDPASDDVYATTTTGDDPLTIGTQHGYYKFSYVLPNTYWVSIEPTNFASAAALDGLVSTTGNSVTRIVMSNSQTVTSHDIGFIDPGQTWSLLTGGNVSLGSGAALTSGRLWPSTNSTGPVWWDQNWQYRIPVTVTAGAEALTTNHTIQLGVELNTLVSAAQAQSDFDDVRMVYWNGSTNVPIAMDIVAHNIERWKVQTALSTGASDANYYLYYGNPEATAPSTRLSQVYHYYDGFNQPDSTTHGSWQESDSDTNWAISGNAWRYNATTVGDRFSKDTSFTFDMRDDWNLEADMTINSGGVAPAAGLAYIRPDSIAEDKYWLVYKTASDRAQFYNYNYGSSWSGELVGATDVGTRYTVGSLFAYSGPSSRVFAAYLDHASLGISTHNASAYDIWNSGTYPGNLYTASPGLVAYSANTSFDNYKAWQAHDASVATGSIQSLYPSGVVTADLASGQVVTFSRLQSFRADTISQGGTVRFVLSNDNGATWLYWNGSAWATSNSTTAEANTAATINTNATSFPTGSEQLRWRAVFDATANTRPTVLSVGLTSNRAPSTPNVTSPADNALLTTAHPTFVFSDTDPEGENVSYQLDLDTSNTFASTNLRSYDVDSNIFGWSGQQVTNLRRYDSGATGGFHVPVPLSTGTWYWRVRAIDPEGANVASSYDSGSFSVVTIPTTSQPVLTNVTSTSMTVNWTTNVATTSVVRYGTTTGMTSSVTDGVTGTIHSVTVTGLTTGTGYYYQATGLDSYSQTAASAVFQITLGSQSLTADPVVSTPTTTPTTTVTAKPIGPTVYRPVTRSASRPRLILPAIARGQQTVTFYLDGKRVGAKRTTWGAGTTKSLYLELFLDRFTYGSHSVKAQSTDALGRKSAFSRSVTFSILRR